MKRALASLIGVTAIYAAAMTPAICTADTTTGTQPKVAPYSEIVREIQKHQYCGPTSIVFEVSEGPMKVDGMRVVPNETSSPMRWRHVIVNEAEIARIMQALQNVEYAPPRGDYAGKARYYPMLYKLTLVYDYPYSRDKLAPPVRSITLDLSGAYANVWNYRVLEDLLKPYEPGFKAQQHVLQN